MPSSISSSVAALAGTLGLPLCALTRRNAVCHSAAFAADLTAALAIAGIQGTNNNVPASTPVASRSSSPSLAQQQQQQQQQQHRAVPARRSSMPAATVNGTAAATVSTASASSSSSSVCTLALRLSQRRDAVSNLNSRALRMALRLPITPSPGPSLFPTPMRSPTTPTATSGLGEPKPVTHEYPLQGELVHPSPITGPLRRLQITLEPVEVDPLESATAADALQLPYAVTPAPFVPVSSPLLTPRGATNDSLLGSIHAPSPRVRAMTAFFVSPAASLSATPTPVSSPPPPAASAPPPGTTPAEIEMSASSQAPQRSSAAAPGIVALMPGLRRRRTAIVMHGDFRNSIPEEWRNAEQGEDDAAAPRIAALAGPEVAVIEAAPAAAAAATIISPRIRSRRPSVPSVGRGLPLNARRALLSVDLGGRGNDAGVTPNSDDPGTGGGALDAPHSPFFSPSSTRSEGNEGENGVPLMSRTDSFLALAGVCVEPYATPLSALSSSSSNASFTSPSSSSLVVVGTASSSPLARRYSVTGASTVMQAAAAMVAQARLHPQQQQQQHQRPQQRVLLDWAQCGRAVSSDGASP